MTDRGALENVRATPDKPAGAALVSFSATTQPTWVKVTDAKGTVVLSRTISPGEQVASAGALPLMVVVGRADVTRVLVRGTAFDLSAYARENVARFEVK
jgi:cytoskeleton protein RodZ